MGIAIELYSPDRVTAVRAFNERLKAGGSAFRFPEHCESKWLPKTPGETLYEEHFIAIDGDAVRGGYILKHQPFWLGSEVASVGSLYLPLSEGIVNREHGRLGAQLLMHALAQQPLLYSLGMGGFDNPYPRLLKAAGWQMCAVPFYFMVLNAGAFCRNITHLRHRASVRTGLDILAATGLGKLAFNTIHALRRHQPDQETQTVQVREFDAWANEPWSAGRTGCSLAAVRDLAALKRLYPADKERYLKLKVMLGETAVGWAVVFDTAMKQHKHFGEMRVGSIIDCFAAPGRQRAVIHAATNFLKQRGVDLIVTNQSHHEWGAALDHAGYLSGPSNFIFAASPALAAKLGPWESARSRIHFTRADGEGPTHL